MFKTITATTLMAAASASINQLYDYDWYLPEISFKAIEQSFYSRYWLKGKYGPNNMGYWGQNAYIFLEVGGDEIADGAIVATWATIVRPEEFTTRTDPFSGEVTTTKVNTGLPYIQTETVECAVKYRDLPLDGSNNNTYISKDGKEQGVAYNIAADDIRVNSWSGKIQNNQYSLIGKNYVW